MKTWEIRGKKVEFDETKHAYYCDGKRCISVTQLLKFKFPSKYDGIDPEVLAKAAERGSYYHACVEMYEKYGIESNEIQEFRNYLFLKEKFKFEVLDCEIPIIVEYKNLIICGQTDLLIKENNQLGICDEKYTSTCDKEYLAYQTNLYRLGIQQSYGKQIDILRGIHLKNEQRKYFALPINEQMVYQLIDDYLENCIK